MEINLKKLVGDIVTQQTIKWAGKEELAQELCALLASRSWDSVKNSYNCAEVTIEETGKMLKYVIEPMPIEVWKPILTESFSKALTMPKEKVEGPQFIMTEEINRYIGYSKQVENFTELYINTPDEEMRAALVAGIEGCMAKLSSAEMIRIVKNDDGYNDKCELLRMLNNEMLESALDYLCVTENIGQGRSMSRRTKEFLAVKSAESNGTFNIQKFLKNFSKQVNELKLAKDSNDMNAIIENEAIVRKMIEQFDAKRPELEARTAPSKELSKAFKECVKIVDGVKTEVGMPIEEVE